MSKKLDDEWLIWIEVIDPALAPEFSMIASGGVEKIGEINSAYNDLLTVFTDEIPQLLSDGLGLFWREFTARDGRILQVRVYLERIPF